MANIKISELDELGVISFQDEIPIVDVSEKETKKVKIHQFSDTITPLTPMPIGTIFVYGGKNAPDGYLFANGQEVSRTEYSDLFNVYGTIYGEGDGETTFNVPNLCGRVVIGTGQTQDISGESMTFSTVGSKGGEFRHQLNISEMPSHNHNIQYFRNSIGTGTTSTAQNDILGVAGNTTSTSNTGGNQKHNNIQPYIVQNYIIKATNDSKTFTDTVVEQTEEFNQHVDMKINIFNQNASDKTDVFNLNSTTKTDEFNSNVETKTIEFNTNASEKVEEFNSNAENKVNEFNSNIDDLIQEVEDCYNNMLTNEVEGTNIYVDDSANARVLELDIDGNSYQEVRSGKNLFDKNNFTPTNLYVGLGKSIYETSGVTKGFIFDVSELSYLTISKVSSSRFGVSASIEYPVANGQATYLQDITSTNTKFTYDFTNFNYLVVSYWGNGVDTLTEQEILNSIQLEQGTTATEYEQYGASPSPDYPSEVEVVKGYNLFDKNNRNVINGYINSTSSEITSSADSKTLYIPCLPNTTYTVTKIKSERFSLATTNDVPKISDVCYGTTVNHTSTNLSLTTNETAKYLLIFYFNKNLDTLPEQDILDSIQIVKGKSPKPYVPYKNIGVKTTGKNLFNISIWKNVTLANSQGKVVVSDKSITIDNPNGTDIYTISGMEATGSTIPDYRKKYLIEVKPNTEYTISLDIDGTTSNSASANSCYFSLIDKNFKVTNQGSIGQFTVPTKKHSKVITTSSDTKYFAIRFGCTSIAGITRIYSNIQIEQNNASTPYEPYQENITYIDLQDNEICKVGDIKDNLKIKDNQIILTKRIGKIVLDGSENGWSLTDKGGTTQRFDNKLTNMGISNIAGSTGSGLLKLSTHFQYKSSNSNVWGYFYISKEWIVFTDNDNIITSLEEFKSVLSSLKPTIYYDLAEPYEVNLGRIETPKTINHVTNVNLLATIETNMKLKYVRSTNVVIDNLAKAIIAMGGEV